jgi:hypothetical protein
MPLDDTLPPSRLPTFAEFDQILTHFPAAFDIRVDTEGLDLLPPLDRQRYAGARPPEPPEAVLLDRVLQIVPPSLLKSVERIVTLRTRGTARLGGSLLGIVALSAEEARLRERDVRFTGNFSLFTTTVLHEVGHAVFDAFLSEAQRGQVERDFFELLDKMGVIPPGEPSPSGIEHHFVGYFIAAVLGHAEPPISAGEARRYLAHLGLDMRQR